jgi:hypothetical protein
MSERTAAVVVDGIVENVIVISADHVLADGEIEYTEAAPAGIGWEYDGTGFIPSQPFPSWTLNGYVWEPPIPVPDDGAAYYWDEATTSWLPAE